MARGRDVTEFYPDVVRNVIVRVPSVLVIRCARTLLSSVPLAST